MSNGRSFWVKAAEYSGMDFKDAISGTEEMHGPFRTYDEAFVVWRQIATKWIDVCTHKAEIITA